MQWEVYTIGGGSILVDIFNAVVTVIGTTAYKKTLSFVIVVGVAWVAIQRAFDGGRHIETIKYAATFGLVWLALVVPTGTVKVTDSLNPALAPATVSNVPIGLGFFAEATSAVGHELTKLMESSFSLPNDLSYQKNGMVFGSRLMEAATRMQITDSAFGQSIDSYARQCVFPALFLGHLDLNDLMESTDIWTTITASPSPARMFELRERDANTSAVTRTIVTCAVGAPRLTAAWQTELNKASSIFSRRFFPSRTNQAARARLLAALPVSHNYLIGTSKTALEVMRQQMMINAIHNSANRWIGETGNAAAMNAYIQARTDVQTRSAYQSIGIAAGKLVPTLKAVFEGLFYGFFPIAVLLMMTPVGLAVFKNYFFGFVWLQSWGPLYAILNRMMMSDAEAEMQAIADMGDESQGISMVAQAGIRAVEADIAVSAGYMSASIPFIALLLIKGGIHYASSLATSYLAVGQQAAGEAAREGTTGNISLGNTTQDVHSFAKTEGFRSHQSPDYNAARFSTVEESGAQRVHGADGRDSAFPGTSIGDTGTSINFAGMQSGQLRESASESRALAESQSAQASSHFGAAATSGASLADRLSEGGSVSNGWSQSLSGAEQKAFSESYQDLTRFSDKHGLSRDSVVEAAVAGQLGAESPIPWLKAGITTSGSASGKSLSQDAVEEFKHLTENKDFKESFSRGLSFAQSASASSSNEELRSLGESYSSNLTEARNFDESAAANLSEAQSFEQQADRVESQSAAYNQNVSGLFYDYVAGQPGLNGQELGYEGANRLFYSRNSGDQEAVRHLANDFIKDHFKQEPLPGPEGLQEQFNTTRDDLSNQAGVDRFDDGNRSSVLAGGDSLTRPDIDGVRAGVQSSIAGTEGRIDQGHDQVVTDNAGRKEEIRGEANKSASASALKSVIGKENYEKVSDFFDDENTAQSSSLSGGDPAARIAENERISRQQPQQPEQREADVASGINRPAPSSGIAGSVTENQSDVIAGNEARRAEIREDANKGAGNVPIAPESRSSSFSGGDLETKITENERISQQQQQQLEQQEGDLASMQGRMNRPAPSSGDGDRQRAAEKLGGGSGPTAQSGRKKG